MAQTIVDTDNLLCICFYNILFVYISFFKADTFDSVGLSCYPEVVIR